MSMRMDLSPRQISRYPTSMPPRRVMVKPSYQQNVVMQQPPVLRPHGPGCTCKMHSPNKSSVDLYPKSFPIHRVKKWIRYVGDLTFGQRSYTVEQIQKFQAMPETKLGFYTNTEEKQEKKAKKRTATDTSCDVVEYSGHCGLESTSGATAFSASRIDFHNSPHSAAHSSVPTIKSNKSDEKKGKIKDLKKAKQLYGQLMSTLEPHLGPVEKRVLNQYHQAMNKRVKDTKEQEITLPDVKQQDKWIDLNTLIQDRKSTDTMEMILPYPMMQLICEYATIIRSEQIQICDLFGLFVHGPHAMVEKMQRVDLLKIVEPGFQWLPALFDWMDQYLSIAERLVLIWHIQTHLIAHNVNASDVNEHSMDQLGQKESDEIFDYLFIATRLRYLPAVDLLVQFTQELERREKGPNDNFESFIRFWKSEYDSYHARQYMETQHSLTVYDRHFSWKLSQEKTENDFKRSTGSYVYYESEDLKNVLPIRSPTHIKMNKEDDKEDDEEEESFLSKVGDQFFNFVHAINSQGPKEKFIAASIFETWCTYAQRDDDFLLWLIREILEDPALFEQVIEQSTLFLDYPFQTITSTDAQFPISKLKAAWFGIQLWLRAWKRSTDAWQKFPLEFIHMLLGASIYNTLTDLAKMQDEDTQNKQYYGCYIQLAHQLIEENIDKNSMGMQVLTNKLYNEMPLVLAAQAKPIEKWNPNYHLVEEIFFSLKQKSDVAKARLASLVDSRLFTIAPEERPHGNEFHSNLVQFRTIPEAQYLLSLKSENYALWFLCYRILNFPSQPWKWQAYHQVFREYQALIVAQNVSGATLNPVEYQDYVSWMTVCKLHEYYGERPWCLYWQSLYEVKRLGQSLSKLVKLAATGSADDDSHFNPYSPPTGYLKTKSGFVANYPTTVTNRHTTGKIHTTSIDDNDIDLVCDNDKEEWEAEMNDMGKVARSHSSRPLPTKVKATRSRSKRRSRSKQGKQKKLSVSGETESILSDSEKSSDSDKSSNSETLTKLKAKKKVPATASAATTGDKSKPVKSKQPITTNGKPVTKTIVKKNKNPIP